MATEIEPDKLTHKRAKRVLLVDDSLVIQRLVQSRLSVDNFEVITASDGARALEIVSDVKPDVILLDVDMPIMNGYDTCRHLKDKPDTKLIPIIFLTAQGKTDDKVKGLDLGAIDYVTKPFDPVELRARVRSAYRMKYLLELLEKKAQIDGLTGLYNRAFFDARLDQEFERARRYGLHISLVILDIDHFKRVNDTYGHVFGDEVLSEVADVLRARARSVDVVARYGGEEFVVILPEQILSGAMVVARRVREHVESLSPRFGEQIVPVTASLGVASTQQLGYTSPQALVEAADKSLYSAKQNGRNQIRVWDGNGPADPPCDVAGSGT